MEKNLKRIYIYIYINYTLKELQIVTSLEKSALWHLWVHFLARKVAAAL